MERKKPKNTNLNHEGHKVSFVNFVNFFVTLVVKNVVLE